MSRATARGAALLAALFLPAALGCSDAPVGREPRTARPPNVVLVLADDLGWGDLRAYRAESAIPTPNIDRLAAQGMRFTDAHSPASVCTPSRYGILTGRYAWRTRAGGRVLRYFDPPLIEAGRLTLPELLRRRGYATAAVGKWHLGLDVPAAGGGFARMAGRDLPLEPDFGAAIEGGPLDRGFDTYFGAQLARVRAFVRDRRFVSRPVREPGGRRFVAPGWEESEKGPIQLAAALEIIERFHAEDPGRPFFLYFAAQAPHRPYLPAARVAGTPVAGTSGAGARGDLVVELDVMLGGLVRRLEELGVARETLIVLTSDNGAEAPGGARRHDPTGGWRGGKGDLWEGGHRVPLIVRWGDGRSSGSTTTPGRVSDRLIGLQDLMATLAEAVGAPLPPDAAEDSESFLAELLGRGGDSDRGHLIHHSAKGRFAVRRGDWKLVLAGRPGRAGPAAAGRLYNLADNPREVDDRSRRHPKVVAELAALLERDRRAGRSARRLR